MEKHPMEGNQKGAFGTHRDTNPVEVTAYEFVTGNLHEEWHGKPEPEKQYIDLILAKAKQAERADVVREQSSVKGKPNDRER